MFGLGHAGDRRGGQRYEAKGKVSLGWREQAEFHTVSATLVNISQHGACFSTPKAPRRGEPAWILVSNSTTELWLRCDVVDINRSWRGTYKVRVRFEESCPYEFLRASIRGVELPGAEPVGVSEEYQDGYFWR